MFVKVSPLEKPYVFEALDKAEIDYIKKEHTVWYCLLCGKTHTEKPKKCSECDDLGIKSESLGDIVGGNNNYIIERKMKGDLLSSLTNDRIYNQLRMMAEIYGSCSALVFEGRFDDVIEEQKLLRKQFKTQGDKKRIKGVNYRIAQLYSIPATCCQYGVSFIQVKDLEELIKMLKYFDYKCGEVPKIRRNRKRIHAALPNIVKQLLTVDGLGMKYAGNIAEKYKTVASLCRALEINSFGGVPGIGPARYQLLKKTFTT